MPAFLGQALGAVGAAEVNWNSALAGAVFVLLQLAFIVLLNDFFDRDVDALKRRMFPETSQKTIPDGILPARVLFIGGVSAGLLAIAWAYQCGELFDRPRMGAYAVGLLTVFVAYSLPPLRMNYRGGGELLEALGVGVALPWFNAYLQLGDDRFRLWWVLPGFAALCLASAIASGLSDEMSDRRGGKRTVVVFFGNARARRTVEILMTAGGYAWFFAAVRSPMLSLVLIAPSLLCVWWCHRQMLQISPRALTNEFAAQREYKLWLHRAIWWGATLMGIALLAERFV